MVAPLSPVAPVHQLSRLGRRIGGSHRYYVRRSQREETRALVTLIIVVVALVAFQSAIVRCRRSHERAYVAVSLAGLWLIPAALAVWTMWPVLLGVWSAFTLAVGHVIFLATRRDLARRTPRTVYGFFAFATRACFALGVVGYGLMLSDILRVEALFGLHGVIAPVGVACVGYGLYLGVLSRDCASVCADVMASRMGLLSGGADAEDVRELPPTICCVCGGELAGPLAGGAGAGGGEAWSGAAGGAVDVDGLDPVTQRIENPFQGLCTSLTGNEPERVVTLACGHRYHEPCIRGWTLVGKKDTCAWCSERVELSDVFPWERHSLLWLQLLDAIRYLIVWNPLILIVVQLVLPIITGRGGGSVGGY